MRLPIIKFGTKGTLHTYVVNVQEGKDDVVFLKREYIFTVIQLREKDFILHATDTSSKIKRNVFCKWPENKQDGSEFFEMNEDGRGFVRKFIDLYGEVKRVTVDEFRIRK